MTSGGAVATTNDLILGRREAASKDGPQHDGRVDGYARRRPRMSKSAGLKRPIVIGSEAKEPMGRVMWPLGSFASLAITYGALVSQQTPRRRRQGLRGRRGLNLDKFPCDVPRDLERLPHRSPLCDQTLDIVARGQKSAVGQLFGM